MFNKFFDFVVMLLCCYLVLMDVGIIDVMVENMCSWMLIMGDLVVKIFFVLLVGLLIIVVYLVLVLLMVFFLLKDKE